MTGVTIATISFQVQFVQCVQPLLSAPPSLLSLSVSVQDLPNNMIHQVPIKSLPQEWLWCETWCDDTSKKKAKTIDLVPAVCLCVEGQHENYHSSY